MAEAMPIESAAKKALKEERLAAEIHHRTEQLVHTNSAASRLNQALQAMRMKSEEHERFVSHLAGFYEEVDKLAKGKTLFPATDMIVEAVNSIIRDAKVIIDRDVYIERLKEFVPAGDNPVYPDILVVTRTIQQANTRFAATLPIRRKRLAIVIKETETIKTALECFIECKGYVASLEEVDKPAESWFIDDDDIDDDDERAGPFFDFKRLDTLNLSLYLTAVLPDNS
jgi:hypothetical protein